MILAAAVAHCHECDWEYDGKNALAVAWFHHKKFNHEVGVDLTHIHIYKKDKEKGGN